MRYHCTPSRMSKIIKAVNTKDWQGCEATRIFIQWWVWLHIVMPTSENNFAEMIKAKHMYNLWPAIQYIGI